MSKNLPTKKQKELLSFIDGFIKGNGYGPSYREVMRALGYKSVSTVATHIDNLIAKGYLVKRTYSARSIELTSPDEVEANKSDSATHHQWLRREIVARRAGGEAAQSELEVLEAAASVLGIDISTPET